MLKAMEDGGGADQTTGHKKEIPTESASVNLLERPGEGAGRGSYNPARDGKLGQAAVPAITREIGDAIGRQSAPIRLLEGGEKAGLKHIEQRHGDQARSLGYADAREMVEDITRNFDAIYLGRGRALILAKRIPVRLTKGSI